MIAEPIAAVIASIEFRDFRVLAWATLELTPFNLLLGPNGSGKTTALQALLALGQVARDRVRGATSATMGDLAGAYACFTLGPELNGARVTLAIDAGGRPALAVEGTESSEETVVKWLSGIRGFVLDPVALAGAVEDPGVRALGSKGEGLAAVLALLAADHAGRWKTLVAEFRRLMPEFSDIVAGRSTQGGFSFSVVARQGKALAPDTLSQGALVVIGVLSIVFGADRPSLLYLEEIERGIHPRLLREVRDLLYRMSFPAENASPDPPVQIVATTHSPYMLDLFGDTPEEVILAMKEEGTATFRRLDTFPELSEMLQTGRLGDLWYSGILGGVP